MKAVAKARSQALCSAYPCTEKRPEIGLASQRGIGVPTITLFKHTYNCRVGTAFPEALVQLCSHQSPMDLRKRRTAIKTMASAATAVPISSSPEASPLHRFVEAGLTTVSRGFNITACFVRWSAAIQIFLLKHPNILTKLVLALFYLHDAIVSNLDKDPEQATLTTRKLKYLGPNFPAYSGVMVGDIDVVKQLILGPQKRGPYIAWGRSVAKAFPDNMLLFLSDKAAGGTGEREQIKAILMDLFTSEAVVARGKDEVAQSLVSTFAREVKGGKPDTLSFSTAYILYVVFGIGPDKATTELVTKGIGPYSISRVSPIGIFKRGLSDGEKQVRALLAQSPLVTGADLKGYDREKFLDALMPILHIAAIPGPATFISYSTTLLPSSFKFDYGSDEANLNAMYEAMRAHPPVASVSSYLQQPTEIEIDGNKHLFPAGTKVMYSIKTASKDPAVHAEALKVDVTRANLATHVLNFASFGPENFGRQCPGRKVAEKLGIDLFRNLGDIEFRTTNP